METSIVVGAPRRRRVHRLNLSFTRENEDIGIWICGFLILRFFHCPHKVGKTAAALVGVVVGIDHLIDAIETERAKVAARLAPPRNRPAATPEIQSQRPD